MNRRSKNVATAHDRQGDASAARSAVGWPRV